MRLQKSQVLKSCPQKNCRRSQKKSHEEIEDIIKIIQTSNPPENIKPFVTGCVRLACWIPEKLKEKDAFEHPSISKLAQDWKYCIEGTDVHGNNLRVIVTFNENLMPIITVIKV